MQTAEELRREVLCQNSFTAEACSPPAATLTRLAGLLSAHDHRAARLAAGTPFCDLMQEDGDVPS
jgi:hypothetical protein